jgi:hypothetical protein
MCHPCTGKINNKQYYIYLTYSKSFIIHTGTNDLEHIDTNEALIKNATDIVELIQTKHPESHIIFSSILPRSDELDKRGMTLNISLEKSISTKKNITFVRHPNINSKYHLKDKKHLNDVGVKRFAQSLIMKRAYFKNPDKPRKNFRNSQIPYNRPFFLSSPPVYSFSSSSLSTSKFSSAKF